LAGRARWPVRLIAQKAVKRKPVERVALETVRILLQTDIAFQHERRYGCKLLMSK
jgi:hypothetical protein